MTVDELRELRELRAKATPGPWDSKMGSTVQAPSTVVAYECLKQDQDFIVAAHTAMPRLLDEIERLQRENGALERTLEHGLTSMPHDTPDTTK